MGTWRWWELKVLSRYHQKQESKENLKGLLIDGNWFKDSIEIREAMASHFENLYREPNKNKGSLRSDRFKQLLNESMKKLEALISMEEVKVAMWACGSDKALGPNGLNFKFLKDF